MISRAKIQAERLPLAAALLGLLALVYFDLGPALAFNDDWFTAWSVRQLAAGHGLRFVPEHGPLGIVGIAWGAIFSLGSADPRLLRLSVIPFILAAALCVHRLARHLGADRFWAATAAATPLCAPVFLGVSTSFMTDVFYVGLLALVAVAGVRWVETGRGAVSCCVLVAISFMERQHGVVAVLALGVGLLVARRSRQVRAREWLYLALTGAVLLGGFYAAGRAGLLTYEQTRRAGGASLNPRLLLQAYAFLPSVAGLVLLPMLGALLVRGSALPTARRWLPGLLSLGLLALLAVHAATHLDSSVVVFPGDVWTLGGLNPVVDLAGAKPQLFPPVFWLTEGLAVVAAVALFGWRAGDISRLTADPAVGAAVVFLLTLALAQLLPSIGKGINDRYFLPVLIVMLPVVARVASRAGSSRAARGWALAGLLGGVALYAVGEQDYQAWQVARDGAARLAYQQAPPSEVLAGWEADGVYYELPIFDAYSGPTGNLVGSSQIGGGRAATRLQLIFGPASDPRPGVNYNSVAPGRIVIVARP